MGFVSEIVSVVRVIGDEVVRGFCGKLSNSCFSAVHLDLVSDIKQLDFILSKNLESYSYLSLGVIDTKNIWKNNLSHSLKYLKKAAHKLGSEKIQVAPASSLIFVPYDKNLEDFSTPAMKKNSKQASFC